MEDGLAALLRRKEQDHLKQALLTLDPKVAKSHYELANKCRDGLALLAEQEQAKAPLAQ